jgi:hypothetical protein
MVAGKLLRKFGKKRIPKESRVPNTFESSVVNDFNIPVTIVYKHIRHSKVSPLDAALLLFPSRARCAIVQAGELPSLGARTKATAFNAM